ncbi:Eef2k [Symbiodinium natans]|uniref:Eef2k protein n=1 Tax=Symbiodinium natans TaxID=878477 RepID=A0A812TPH0_9DINO|nr:Eef2k [Symbiodinium natans]
MTAAGGRSPAVPAVWVGLFVISQCLLPRQTLPGDFVALEPSRGPPRGLRSLRWATSEDASAAPSFEAGGRAMLTGFTERTSLNGEPVELIRWDEEQQGWVVRRQTEQSITSLVSLKNLMPYPEKEEPAKPKEREFSPVSFLATIIGALILLSTAVAVLVPLVSGLYKDMTGEYLVRLDVPSLY